MRYMSPGMLAALGFFILLTLAGLIVPAVSKTASLAIAAPIWKVRDTAVGHMDEFFSYFQSKTALERENAVLKDKLAAAELQSADHDTITAENAELKSLLGLTDTKTKIVSRVLARPPQSPYDTLIIDTGSSEGIAPGAKVYLSDTLIVGTVTNVTSHTSLVTLFSNPTEKTSAELVRTSTTFEIEGQGGGNMKVTVPKETDMIWGDNFIYPGLSGDIGTIYYIDSSSQSSFKTAFVRLPSSIFSAKWVYIEKQ